MKNIKKNILILLTSVVIFNASVFAGNQESVLTQEPTQQQITLSKPFYPEYFMGKNEKLEFVTSLFPHQIDSITNQKDDPQVDLNIFAQWLKDEWTQKNKENLDKEKLKQLFKLNVKFIEEIIKDKKNYLLLELCTLEDFYKPAVLALLFPGIAEDLKDVNIQQRDFCVIIEWGKTEYSYCCSFCNCLPQEIINQVTQDIVEKFNKLTPQEQVIVLLLWLTTEWFYELNGETIEIKEDLEN